MRFAIFAAVLCLSSAALASSAPPNVTSLVAAPSGNVIVPSVPVSLTGSGTFTSACIVAEKYRAFDVFAATAAVATLQVQRYADASCTYVTGAKVPSLALTLTNGASCPSTTYCGDVGSNDGLPFSALKIILIDTSTSTNAITTLTLIQGAE